MCLKTAATAALNAEFAAGNRPDRETGLPRRPTPTRRTFNVSN